MIKFIELNYYCHEQENNINQIADLHLRTSCFALRLNEICKLIIIKHAAFKKSFSFQNLQYQCFQRKNSFFQIPFKTHFYIKQQKPDVILIHGLVFPVQIIALRFLSGRKPIIMVQHHAETPFRNPVKKWLQKIADSNIDAYLFHSNGNASAWIKKGILSKEKCIETCIAPTNFKAIEKLKRDKIKFIWVGRLNANKDPVTIIKAFVKFAATNKNITLQMIYQTEELLEAIKKIIAENNMQEQVTLSGKKTKQEVEAQLREADFFISGSYNEGSGYALVEAMSCGCIPVVSNIPPFFTTTKNGTLGFLFEAGNEEAILQELYKTQSIDIALMRKEIIWHAQNNFSCNAVAEKLLSIAENLIAQQQLQ